MTHVASVVKLKSSHPPIQP